MADPKSPSQSLAGVSPEISPLHGEISPGDKGHLLDKWISWRFTTPYKQRITKLFEDSIYVACWEKSKKGVEHYHVVSIGHSDYERIKKAIQRMDDMKGVKNWYWSKKNSGTLEKALAYTLKTRDNDGNDRWFSSVSFDSLDIKYDPWVYGGQSTIPTKEVSDCERKKIRDWQLTYSNLVPQALHFHHVNGLNVEIGLKETVRLMLESTKWRPSPGMYRDGVSVVYEEDFAFRLGKRPRFNMDWYTPKMR